MSSTIKRHRRNVAVEQDQDTYRQSVPVLQGSIFRHSFDVQYEPKSSYRASDLSQLPPLTPRPKESLFKRQISVFECQNQKTQKKFLSTFNNLQLKLAQAKKQLTIPNQKQLCQFSLQLNAFHESKMSKISGLDKTIFDKMEESTINLQSNKKLINAVKSKDRLIWANKIKTYYLKETVKGIAGINQRALEHVSISHQIFKESEQMELPDQTILPRNKVQLKVSPENIGKKVLVLDLDQTLFHCEQNRLSPEDIEVDIPIEDGTFEKAYVSIRPYAISFLKRCRKNFEIIAFTASEKCYADAILNEIDPDFQYISHRLYRQHCVKLHNKVYAKDLRIINRDLSKMVLVDNSPLSYLYQMQNGIPILPYYNGEDCELLALEKYLDKVILQKDVRKLNLRTFKLYQYSSFEDCQTLIKQLYCQNNAQC